MEKEPSQKLSKSAKFLYAGEALLLGTQIVDSITTSIALSDGLHEENPILSVLYSTGNPFLPLAVRAVMLSLFFGGMEISRRRNNGNPTGMNMLGLGALNISQLCIQCNNISSILIHESGVLDHK